MSEFQINIGHKQLNGHAIAKYTNGDSTIVLKHEINGEVVDTWWLEELAYDTLCDEAEEQGLDLLAYLLDFLFCCDMLDFQTI